MKPVENLREVRTLYKIVCDRDLTGDSLKSVKAIQYLEQITQQKFKNAKDLKEKMNDFIYKQEKLIVEGDEH